MINYSSELQYQDESPHDGYALARKAWPRGVVVGVGNALYSASVAYPIAGLVDLP
jgi:hypothetical protein